MGTTEGKKKNNNKPKQNNMLQSEASSLRGKEKKEGTQRPEEFRNKRCFVADRAIYKLGYEIKLLFYSRKKE